MAEPRWESDGDWWFLMLDEMAIADVGPCEGRTRRWKACAFGRERRRATEAQAKHAAEVIVARELGRVAKALTQRCRERQWINRTAN